jgi:hypothetical protein
MNRFLAYRGAAILALGIASTLCHSGPEEIVMYRIFAHVFVDVSRQVCAGEDQSAKDKLESALQSSGLLELNVDTLCAGGVCGEYTAKEMRLDVALKSTREQHLQMYARKSPDEKHADCLKFITMFERMHGGKGKPPEKIYEVFLENMQ